jgi:hypothetical protein
VTYVFLVAGEGRAPVLARDLDQAAVLAGGSLSSDFTTPGRFATSDGSVTATPYALELIGKAPGYHLSAVA